MVTISKKEYIIYKQIKTLSLEYDNRIPMNILKMELEIYKEYLEDVLSELTTKGIIIQDSNNIELNRLNEKVVVSGDNKIAISNDEVRKDLKGSDVKNNEIKESHENSAIGNNEVKETFEDLDIKNNEVKEIKEEIENLELNKKEKESLKILINLIKDDKTVSRHLLEGNLLYGELKLSNFSMYHVLLSLENSNIIKMIKKTDGDYYKLLI
ncbi:MAG: hypothetical protein LBR15_01715 [Methanobrevibacter sp.]|jgi:hypothetical protein|nr:hypothetical protein [Candidatus Methanovirga australis]